MKFVIIHGAFGSPEGNWFPELKEKLEALSQEVICVQFPVEKWDEVTKNGPKEEPKNQILDNWLKTFEKEVLPKIKKGEKLCFIGHSLGPLFILHVVEKFNIQLDSAIFVSPFLDKLNRPWQIDLVNKTFYKTDFNFEKLIKLIPVSYVLYSDNDPYVDKNHAILFGKALNSSLVFVKRAGHMNSEVNLNEFPLVFDLCLTRLDLDLYQRYLHHVADRYATDFIRNNKERVLYLKEEDIFDEGRFHFSQLKSAGYANFLTNTSVWDPENQYYLDARKAAKRTGNLTRMFLVEDISDLKNPILLKHIKLDVEGEVKVYMCMFDEIKEEVKDPDFGVWDEDYVCTIHYADKREIKEIVLSSRKEDIKRAENWRDLILKKATRIINVDKDIENFIKTHSS